MVYQIFLPMVLRKGALRARESSAIIIIIIIITIFCRKVGSARPPASSPSKGLEFNKQY